MDTNPTIIKFINSYGGADKHTNDNNKGDSSGVIMCKPCYQTKEEWQVTIVPSVETDDEKIIQELKWLMENLVFNQARQTKEGDN